MSEQTPSVKRALVLFCVVIAVVASSCKELSKGLEAFYAGRFQEAIGYLQPMAVKLGQMNPTLEVSVDDPKTLDQVLPRLTQEPFQIWNGYAGSLFGLKEVKEGCVQTRLALRPLRVIVHSGGKTSPLSVDPMQGDFWQPEVMTLRAWWWDLDCEGQLKP